MPYWFDGNNLIGQSAAMARQDRTTRKSFLALLGEHALARGGRFVVFFDGDDHDRSMPPRGVRVRYSAPLSADDAILRDVQGASARSEIIIVTNDHCLASSCRGLGVKTMDWRQFSAKMASSSGKPAKTVPKEEKIDLEDWSHYFGLDPKKLK
jgi:hypothetical protein